MSGLLRIGSIVKEAMNFPGSGTPKDTDTSSVSASQTPAVPKPRPFSHHTAPRMMPANVENVSVDHACSSSEDEAFDLIAATARVKSRSRLPLLAAALNSRPESPRSPGRPAKRLPKDYELGVVSLVSTVHNAQRRLLAKSLRYWCLKPVLSRFHATERKLRSFQRLAEHVEGVMLLRHAIERTGTLTGARRFLLKLNMAPDKDEADLEWENAAEHIQKLRDLLALNILTSVIDRVQEGTAWSAMFAISRLRPVASHRGVPRLDFEKLPIKVLDQTAGQKTDVTMDQEDSGGVSNSKPSIAEELEEETDQMSPEPVIKD